MDNDKRNNIPLPMMALEEIPVSKEDASSIVALIKEEGRVVGYKLSDNRMVMKEEAINLARNGFIKGVGIARRNGNEYLKSLPDSAEDNNLSNLSSITKKDMF